MFLVIVDADSKWMKIEVVNIATTVATVEQLRVMFPRFGLPKFLFHYRLIPHTMTGVAPAELMLRQRPCSHMDLIVPNLKDKIKQQQQRQKSQHDKSTRQRIFQ